MTPNCSIIGNQKESAMTKKKRRRKYTAEEKATILRRHLVEKVAISDLCDEYHLSPSQFYKWQKQAMDNMATALTVGSNSSESDGQVKKLSQKNDELEARLVKKDNVIALISEEFVKLKKELGEL